MDEATITQLLLKRLGETGGTVTSAWWQIVLRSLGARPDAMERIVRAGDAWRREHGLDPDEHWILGGPAI